MEEENFPGALNAFQKANFGLEVSKIISDLYNSSTLAPKLGWGEAYLLTIQNWLFSISLY